MSGVFDRRPGVAASGDESVAAGGDIGVAVTGAGAVGTQYTQQHIGQYIDKATIVPGQVHPHPSPRPDAVDAPPGGRMTVKRGPDGNRSEIIAWLQRLWAARAQGLWLYAYRGLRTEADGRGRARPDGLLAPVRHFPDTVSGVIRRGCSWP
jgi:hypothetical protein